MRITNPIDTEVSIQYKGVKYSIPANGSSELPEEVAMYWKNHIHNFLHIGNEPTVEIPVATTETDTSASDVATKVTKRSTKK